MSVIITSSIQPAEPINAFVSEPAKDVEQGSQSGMATRFSNLQDRFIQRDAKMQEVGVLSTLAVCTCCIGTVVAIVGGSVYAASNSSNEDAKNITIAGGAILGLSLCITAAAVARCCCTVFCSE